MAALHPDIAEYVRKYGAPNLGVTPGPVPTVSKVLRTGRGVAAPIARKLQARSFWNHALGWVVVGTGFGLSAWYAYKRAGGTKGKPRKRAA